MDDCVAGRWYDEAHDVGPVDWERTELWLFGSEPMVVADNEDARPSRAAGCDDGISPKSRASVARVSSSSSSETLAGNCRTTVR